VPARPPPVPDRRELEALPADAAIRWAGLALVLAGLSICVGALRRIVGI
jgi:hypothetical protein